MVTGCGAMNLRERGRFRKILYHAEHFTTLLGREAVKKDGIFSRYELLHYNANVPRWTFVLCFVYVGYPGTQRYICPQT